MYLKFSIVIFTVCRGYVLPCPLCGLDELLVHQYKSWLDRFYIYESAEKVPDRILEIWV